MAAQLLSSVFNQVGYRDINRGRALFRSGMVYLVDFGTGGVTAAVTGTASEPYFVGLSFSGLHEGELGVYCDCKQFVKAGMCKHVCATIYASEKKGFQAFSPEALQYYECEPCDIEVDSDCSGVLHNLSTLQGQATLHGQLTQQPSKIETSTPKKTPRSLPQWQQQLQAVSHGSLEDSDHHLPDFHRDTATEQKIWFVISLADFQDDSPLIIRTFQSKRKKDRQWGKPALKGFTTSERSQLSDPTEKTAFENLDPIDLNPYRFHSQYSSSTDYQIPTEVIGSTLELLADTGRLVWDMEASRYLDDPQTLQFTGNTPWELQVSIAPVDCEDGKQRIVVSPSLIRNDQQVPIEQVIGISGDGVVLHGDQIGLLAESSVTAARRWQAAGKITVPMRNLSALMDEVENWSDVSLELDSALPIQTSTPTPTPRLHLSTPERNESFLIAKVLMIYGDQELDVVSGRQLFWDRKSKELLYRNREAETSFLHQLKEESFRWDHDGSGLNLRRRDLPSVVTELTEAGWEVIADGNAMRRASGFNIEVVSGVDWFDLDATADFDGLSVSLPELLKARHRNQGFIVLDDGSHGIVPEKWLAKFGNLEETGTIEEDSIRFTKTQALLLDTMLGDQEDVSLDRAFKAWCKNLNSFEGIQPVNAPKGFQGDLREYQEIGLGWFQFLQKFRLGGCLADDMGLGKTVQVLAMLEQRRVRRLKKDETRQPSIVIVPKSLIFNWIEEAKRFAPKLSIMNYTGSERKELRDQFASHDIIMTTYGTMRNDSMILQEQSFDYAILDEAQAIKNPKSLAAKATRLLQADHKLAMTGTPVENHLGDLWSLFDFLNPGMLGQTIGKASMGATAENVDRLNHVAKSLRPFILRRTKKEVLTELPDKTEQTLYCDMEPKQKKLYAELRDHYRNHISNKVKELGIAKSKIHVLEALLRLRQAACDPRLVNPSSDIIGAKLLRLVEQIEELRSEGHKALIFSQFTSLLSLLRTELDQRDWDYEYLDGKTRKRQEPVKRFQEDPNCQLFLISLKAGGHGLNLTAADYVFILDPWWNPAVEAQAIDRAHRMGQTKPVVAYRMICRDTVEEKIIDLQASKRKLADAIITQKQSLISDLTKDDLQSLFT